MNCPYKTELKTFLQKCVICAALFINHAEHDLHVFIMYIPWFSLFSVSHEMTFCWDDCSAHLSDLKKATESFSETLENVYLYC